MFNPHSIRSGRNAQHAAAGVLHHFQAVPPREAVDALDVRPHERLHMPKLIMGPRCVP
jgi:hypothetical protein